MSVQDESITLTKDQYDEIISQATVNRENNSFMLIKDSSLALELFQTNLSALQTTGFHIHPKDLEYISKWEKREPLLGVMLGDETKYPKYFALVSKSNEQKYFLNLLLPVLPFSDVPMEELILCTLEKIAKELNVELELPHRYLEFTKTEQYQEFRKLYFEE
jgi:hypothetical protein